MGQVVGKPATSGDEERRHRPRLPIAVPVFLGVCDEVTDPIPATLIDLSLGGMAIEPPVPPLRLGQSVCLCLRAEADCAPSSRIEAVVANVGAGRVGLQFASVGVDVLQDIHRMLRSGRYF